MNWLILSLLFVANAMAFEQQALGDQGHSPKVAIIGAGVAGASAAYHLANFTNGNVNIELYDTNKYIGGRIESVDIEGLTFELGASIFDGSNTILMDAVKEFNLSFNDNSKLVPDEHKDELSLGVWNGEEFKFELQEGGKLSTYWQIAKRFGLRAPRRAGKLREEIASSLAKLYDEQFPWTNLGKAAAASGVEAFTNVSAAECLQSYGIDRDMAENFIQGFARVNFSLDLEHIHALAALLSFLPADALLTVEGGNWQILDGMIKKSKANLHLDTAVTSVIYDPITKKWNINTEESMEEFDYVVLAAPAQDTNIRFVPEIKVTPVDYIGLYTSYVVTDKPLDASERFGSNKTYNNILTIPNNKSHEAETFTAIKHTAVTKAGHHVYRMFSVEEPTDSYVSDIFGNVKIVDIVSAYWYNSYPDTKPVSDDYPDVELSENLFYTSSMDVFLSTIETNALSGKNVARLIADKLV